MTTESTTDKMLAAMIEVSEAQADALEQQWEQERTYATLAEALAAGDIPEPDRWMVTDDSAANWALRKLAAEVAEIERIDAQADAEILRIKQWAEQAKKQPEHDAAFFESRLLEYRRCLEVMDPDLRPTYGLPAGELKRTAGRKSVKVTGKDEFVMWALDNRPSALNYSPLVSDLAGYHREAGALFDPETGERIPGVEEVTADPTYSVKVTTSQEPFG